MIPIDFLNGKVVYCDESLDQPEPYPKEDLLQVEYSNGKILDVGWYPEGNPEGHYAVVVISDDWDTPLFKATAQNTSDLYDSIRIAIDFIVNS